MFGVERLTGKIWYCFDEGINFYKEKIKARNLIDIKQIETHNYQIITAIDYDVTRRIYTLFLFNFSHLTSSLCLMKDRTCQNEDYESWYTPRASGSCFQGLEVSYMKKKPLAMCIDYQTWNQTTIKPCPCALEDFNWYDSMNYSKPNSYSQNNFCVLEPFSNFNESIKSCQDGGIALNHLNGYDILSIVSHNWNQILALLCQDILMKIHNILIIVSAKVIKN
ncbi:hypothetical protein RF11_01933 [Thelohanellus kitauei]|uniref:Sortilin C-terminal domain-containing protein n=1 Tax=Thelohanellus kitauei TaxID=669202 RepID=A0A0C2MB45_THEKT|nr:hypothetical protein RF11_01933 [Thelohanellus kitauei]